MVNGAQKMPKIDTQEIFERLVYALAVFFLMFWYQSSVSGEYFSGDTVVTTIDNKTKPIQNLKLLDQVLVNSDLVLYETHLSTNTNNFKIDSTWQIARFEFLGNVITLAKPEQEFIGKGITENSKGGTFLGEKIFKLPSASGLAKEKFTLIRLAQVVNDKDVDNKNAQFITAIIKYQSQPLTKYIFTDNENKEVTITCGDAVQVYDENDQQFIAISELAIMQKKITQFGKEFSVSISDSNKHAASYMIELKDVHHFYANGILVHNPDDPKDDEKEEEKDQLGSLSEVEDQVDIMKISLEDAKNGVKY